VYARNQKKGKIQRRSLRLAFSFIIFFFVCFRVCALDLPILADWLSVSNLNLKSEQRDVSRRVAKNSRTQLPTTTKRKRKRKKQK